MGHVIPATALAVAVVALGGAPPPPAGPPPGYADRMIFAKEAARELWASRFPPPAMFWTPEIADVLKLERLLPAYLRRAHKPVWKRVASYKRQYFGLVKKGRWIVHASFFCDAHGKDWRSLPVIVKDGGDCYFEVEYDPKTGRFSQLAINGGA
jgi:hypothetical protein